MTNIYRRDWRMPPEWAPHERTWMAWPSAGYTLGETAADAEEARNTWAAVANAVTRFEPVTMLVNPGDEVIARRHLDSAIELIACPLDDAWMRDIGPTFVKDPSGQLGAVDWVFNGWGQQPWARWQRDSKVAAFIASHIGAPRIESPLINEGGGIHVNESGVILLTKTVQLGQGRNASWAAKEVEDELHRKLGTERAVWFERGLTRDYDEFGTRGHIDIVACFANETEILFHNQTNKSHPDFAVSRRVRETIENAGFTATGVPAPTQLRDAEGWVDYSYINHYLVNGGVILCGFDDPSDAAALDVISVAYPGREVVQLDARPLFARGGGIHCITQQQPA